MNGEMAGTREYAQKENQAMTTEGKHYPVLNPRIRLTLMYFWTSFKPGASVHMLLTLAPKSFSVSFMILVSKKLQNLSLNSCGRPQTCFFRISKR